MAEPLTINIDGVQYPCEPTLGAMVRYREATGEEASTLAADNISGTCRYLYCCVQSACRRAKREFAMEFLDFADAVLPSDLQVWADALVARQADDAKKKTTARKSR